MTKPTMRQVKTALMWTAILIVGAGVAVCVWFIFLSVLILALRGGNGLF